MEKFSRALRGYDSEEVNNFLDKVITQVEEILVEIKKKDEEIASLKQNEKDIGEVQAKLAHYEKMESTLNQAILMAQKTAEQMKSNAIRESETIINEAKSNANRIVNESLLRSERIDRDADSLKRNIKIFKRRLKDIVESQMEIIDDIEKIEL